MLAFLKKQNTNFQWENWDNSALKKSRLFLKGQQQQQQQKDIHHQSYIQGRPEVRTVLKQGSHQLLKCGSHCHIQLLCCAILLASCTPQCDPESIQARLAKDTNKNFNIFALYKPTVFYLHENSDSSTMKETCQLHPTVSI